MNKFDMQNISIKDLNSEPLFSLIQPLFKSQIVPHFCLVWLLQPRKLLCIYILMDTYWRTFCDPRLMSASLCVPLYL